MIKSKPRLPDKIRTYTLVLACELSPGRIMMLLTDQEQRKHVTAWYDNPDEWTLGHYFFFHEGYEKAIEDWVKRCEPPITNKPLWASGQGWLE